MTFKTSGKRLGSWSTVLTKKWKPKMWYRQPGCRSINANHNKFIVFNVKLEGVKVIGNVDNTLCVCL